MISFAQTSTRHQKSQQQQLHQNQRNNQHHDYHQPDCPLELSNDYGFEYMAPSQLSASRLDSLTAFFDSLPLDSMQSDAWGGFTQYTPKLGRFTHQRESSLSSLGSNGPASPFTQQSANPHIAITESSGESLTDVHSHDANTNQGGYYQLGKTMGSLSAYPHMDNAVTDMAYPVTISGPELNHKARVDRGLLPAPDFANPSTRSHPTSVASSVAGDSPATPTVGEADLVVDRRRQGCANVPKLGRTMTDVYGDELYNPNFAITSSSPQAHAPVTCSPVNDMFKQRIHAANSQHLHSARHSPPTNPSRDISPFRAGSPLAPSSHNWNGVHGAVHFNSAQRMREHNKARQDVQCMQHPNTRGTETETPSTISPQDAMLEFNEQDDEANFPLFPQNTDTFGIDQMAGVVASNQPARANMSHEGDDGQFSYLQDQIQSGIQVPQQYPFIARPHIGDDAMMPRLSSTASSSGESSIITTATRGRPAMVGVEGGTYTCTYHGCSLRFETPSLLQKHKREGHRQINGMVGSRPLHDGVASTIMNSQAGPHRCDRINPSTGKSCNTVFSRPYDLTRHEDTIHNARKQKVHCNLCTEEKTFSRADALTRHYRVCHPNVELPGKHRRRGGD